MGVVIRPARPGDAAGVAALLAALGYPCSIDEAARNIDRFGTVPGSWLEVAEADDGLVGLVGMHLIPRLDVDAFSCRVTDLVVDPSRRREGIGRQLIAAAEAYARRAGAPLLDLSSADWRADAHAFYAALGFESGARSFRKRLDQPAGSSSPDAAATYGVVLTGAPGAGKSSVLGALATQLEIEAIAHGALETEELGRGWPWLPAEAWIPQLAAVVGAQRQLGRTLFLLAATIETGGELRALVDAIGADATLVVCLTASPDTIASRLAEREPDRWPGKQDLIDRARRLAHSIPRLDGIDLLVDTDRRDAEAVARDIREAMGS